MSPGPSVDYDSLLINLKLAGAHVQISGGVDQPFLAVKSLVIRVDGQRVDVFQYKTEEEMVGDSLKITPDGYTVNSFPVSWEKPPHFFKSGRIIVLYLGDDQSVLRLLQKELGEQFAGL